MLSAHAPCSEHAHAQTFQTLTGGAAGKLGLLIKRFTKHFFRSIINISTKTSSILYANTVAMDKADTQTL